MKKFMAFFLALTVFTASLAGCGSSNDTTGSEPVPQTEADAETETVAADGELEPTTISVWYTATEADPNDRDHAWMTTVLDAFSKEYPQIKVETTVIGGAGGTDYKTKIAAEVAAKNAPDVFMVWPGYDLEPFVETGAVRDLTSIIADSSKLSNIVDTTKLETMTFDGKIYALTAACDLLGLFYNKQLFADNNLQPPKTIEDLKNVSDIFRDKGITPVALGDSVTWTIAVPYALLYAENLGYDQYLADYAEKKIDYTSEAAVNAMNTLRSVVDANVFSKDFIGIQPAEAKAEFMEGKAAMFLQGTWQMQSLASEMGDNVGYIPFPTVGENGFDCLTLTKGFALSSQSEGAEAAAAQAFLEFMYSEEMVKELVKLNSIPVFKNIDYSDIEMSELQKELIEYTAALEKPVTQLEYFSSLSAQGEYRSAIQSAAISGDIESTLAGLQQYIELMAE